MIQATLKVNKKEYEGRGKDVFSALSAIPLNGLFCKTPGEVVVSEYKGGRGRPAHNPAPLKTAKRFLFLKDARLLLNSKLRRMAIAKSLQTLLNYA